jgi:acetyltransferase-like isoleucine patch superfamily enzyme
VPRHPSRLDRLTAAAIRRVWDWARVRGRITAADPGRYRFAHLGPGAALSFPLGALYNERYMAIGEGTLVGEGVTLAVGWPGEDFGADIVIRIGRGCSIGRGSHIVAHLRIDIGDDVFFGPYVYVTDQNHGYTALDAPIGRQDGEDKAVTIGDGCWLGVGSVILPGTTLGRNVAVAAGAVVRGSFPDHCLIGGVPARILRRYQGEDGWRVTEKD